MLFTAAVQHARHGPPPLLQRLGLLDDSQVEAALESLAESSVLSATSLSSTPQLARDESGVALGVSQQYVPLSVRSAILLLC